MSSNLGALISLLNGTKEPNVSGPVVSITINGYTADVSSLIFRLLNGEKLSVTDVTSILGPDIIKQLLPYADKIMALFGKSSVPIPVPTPVPIPIPNLPTPEDEKPIPLDQMPAVESADMELIFADADWLGGDKTSRATPEELQKIKDGTLDLPPNGVILFGAIVEPNMNPRLLDDKFAYHFLISGKQSGVLEEVIVDRREISENRFLRSVPNRWSNDNPDVNLRHYPGWNVMIKFIPFYGNQKAEDRWITYWLEVGGVKSKAYRISWRHHGLLPKNA